MKPGRTMECVCCIYVTRERPLLVDFPPLLQRLGIKKTISKRRNAYTLCFSSCIHTQVEKNLLPACPCLLPHYTVFPDVGRGQRRRRFRENKQKLLTRNRKLKWLLGSLSAVGEAGLLGHLLFLNCRRHQIQKKRDMALLRSIKSTGFVT